MSVPLSCCATPKSYGPEGSPSPASWSASARRRPNCSQVFRDLAAVGCDILTIGQYLRPSRDHLPMARLYTPREFAELKAEALRMGFRHVESGPLVRSSYHAHEQAASTGVTLIG